MSQHQTSPGRVATCVLGGRDGRGGRARPRRFIWPAARSTRWKLDSLAIKVPSSARAGTMRAGGVSAKRGSFATAMMRARSAGVSA